MTSLKRRALVVGIDHYALINPLFGCITDAQAVHRVLECNHDGSNNFDRELLLSDGADNGVTCKTLRSAIKKLFKDDNEIALLYFAGHGHVESAGGYICGSDCETGDDGVALAEVVHWANQSKARNRIIILDSCFSGIAGAHAGQTDLTEIKTGVTILTASTKDQYADEKSRGGVFTTLLVDALEGGAANLLGEITPGSVYAHIDQSLGSWDQRPVFKTNVEYFVSLRKARPSLELIDLKRIAKFFPERNFEFDLNPTFEPERHDNESATYPAPITANTEIFAILQKMNRLGLVVPEGAPHMWHAAMNSKSCRLTVLGEHYRRLVEEKRL